MVETVQGAPTLLPCPFCDGPARLLKGGPGNCFVRCDACSAGSDDGSEERVIEKWNRRAEAAEARLAPDEVEKWKQAFAAQSRKLQAVLHIPGVREELKTIVARDVNAAPTRCNNTDDRGERMEAASLTGESPVGAASPKHPASDTALREALWATRGMNARNEWLPWQICSAKQAEIWKADASYCNGRREVLLFAALLPAPQADPTATDTDEPRLYEDALSLPAPQDASPAQVSGDGFSMPTDPDWYKRKAELEGDLEIGVGRRLTATINPTPDEVAEMERLAFAALPQWAQTRIRELEATLSAQDAPSASLAGWRDIATAPRDGTSVLLFSDAWSMSWGEVQIGRFEDGVWLTGEGEVEDNAPGFDAAAEVDDDFDDFDSNVGPTHWMPLPASPEQGEAL